MESDTVRPPVPVEIIAVLHDRLLLIITDGRGYVQGGDLTDLVEVFVLELGEEECGLLDTRRNPPGRRSDVLSGHSRGRTGRLPLAAPI
jgi:hypothetical protein